MQLAPLLWIICACSRLVGVGRKGIFRQVWASDFAFLLVNICNAIFKDKFQGSRSQRRYQKQAEQFVALE